MVVELKLLWTIYFDGSKHIAKASIEILIIAPKKEMIHYSLEITFACTHNIVKYETLVQGLKMLLQFQVIKVETFSDSLLIINQINDKWQVKYEKLILYQEMKVSLLEKFPYHQLSHIKWKFNPIAYGLASLGSAISF